MTATKRRPIQALPDVQTMAGRLAKRPRTEAMAEIEHRRRCSIDPSFWDAVELEVNSIFARKDEEEREKERFYTSRLSPEVRHSALGIVDSLSHDLAHAYKEVQEHIERARDPEERLKWMFIRRELNKRRRSL